MTKPLIVAHLAFSVSLASVALGQGGTSDHGTHLVLIGGVNFATASEVASPQGNPPFAIADKPGLAIGLAAAINIGHSFFLEPEAAFSEKGAKLSSQFVTPGGDFTFRGTTSANYLDVPVLLRYNFGNGPYLIAGPNAAFRLSAKTTITACNSPTCSTGTSTDASQFRSVDFDVTVGAGMDFNVRRQVMGVVVRYQKGVTDMASGVAGKSQLIQVLGGWRIF